MSNSLISRARGEIMPIGFNFDRTLEEMIRAGNYGWFSPGLKEHFFLSSSGSGTISVVLLHFAGTMTSRQVIAEMQKDDSLRFPTIEEVLAFGEAKPELQKDFPIAALGFERNLVPYLSFRKSRDGRIASFFWTNNYFGPMWRFLTVLKD